MRKKETVEEKALKWKPIYGAGVRPEELWRILMQIPYDKKGEGDK